METKLTLKLDKAIIQSVKKYAQNNNKSLSKLVELYFRNLVSEETKLKKYSPLVEELSGVISQKELETLDYVGYLEAKYE
jgi:hypothetical protein